MSNGNTMIDLHRLENENEEQFIFRLGTSKDDGRLDMSWDEIANIINKEFRTDESEYRTEAAYRKPYQQAKRYFEANVFKKYRDEDSFLKELQIQKDAVYKEKRKLYDQRREYNKLLISDARAEHLNDKLIRIAENLNKEYPLVQLDEYKKVNTKKEALLALSDWHYGMVTDNIWNTYDTAVCKKRVVKLASKVIEYLELNNIDMLHIALLGDAAHGGCHVSCRVKSEEDVCDQIMHVSEIMAELIDKLSGYVNHVTVYSCYGNHLRTIQNKQDSVDSDNIEKLIPWWLKQRLKENFKVDIVESEYKEFTRINVCGYHICCVHGNLDNFRNLGTTVNTIFSRKFGETIDYTISGDKHHLEEFEQFDIESILIRSLCGTDDYANGKRLYSKPGQTLMIFNLEEGRESTYHIPLN